MRDLRNYLERLQKSLVRRGYEVPEIEDYSEDGLFRLAKMLEEIYNFTEFDDFFGRMQKRFYEDFVRERVAQEDPINTLEENLSEDSVEDNNEGTEIDWSSIEDFSEGIEVEDYSESSEIDWNDIEEFSSESTEVEEIDWNSVEDGSEGELIEEDNSSESFEYDWDNVEDETEGEYIEEEYDWDNVEAETEGESIEEELESGSYEKEAEDNEPEKDDVFSIDKSLLDEIKVQKEEKIISETIKKNNQTIDKLGSLFGSGKKKRRKGK